MKQINNLLYLAFFAITCFLSGCTSDIDLLPETRVQESETKVCELSFMATCPSFADEESGTRASGANWEDGDKIYVHFSSSAYGVGTYEGGKWSITYSGNLSEANDAECSVYYLKGKNVTDEDGVVSFDEKTAIYGCKTACYSFFRESITISALLKPLTSRFRFQDSGFTEFYLQYSSGFISYNQLNLKQDLMNKSSRAIELKFNEDGYTDYVYALGESNVELTVVNNAYVYKKKISQSYLSAGNSGVIGFNRYLGWELISEPNSWIGSFEFNYKAKKIANEGRFDGITDNNIIAGAEDYNIKKIVVECNSNRTSETIISRSDCPVPVYATFSDGTLILSTAEEKIHVLSAGNMFHNFKALTSVDLTHFDFGNTNDFRYMFYRCNSLESLDLSSFDTHNAIDMEWMFADCESLTSLDLSRFDTENVRSFYCMFYNCHNITSINLSSFNTCNVESMSSMFSGCQSLVSLDLSNFDTSNVTDMRTMFSSCYSLLNLDLSNFNTSKVKDMFMMFHWCFKLSSLDISSFDTSKVTNMCEMFSCCYELSSIDLSGFKTDNVTNMCEMFSICGSLIELDLSSFNTSMVSDMRGMFKGTRSLSSLVFGKEVTIDSALTDWMFEDVGGNIESLNISCLSSLKSGIENRNDTGLDYSKVNWTLLD